MSPYALLSISLLFPQLLYLADLILLEKLLFRIFSSVPAYCYS